MLSSLRTRGWVLALSLLSLSACIRPPEKPQASPTPPPMPEEWREYPLALFPAQALLPYRIQRLAVVYPAPGFHPRSERELLSFAQAQALTVGANFLLVEQAPGGELQLVAAYGRGMQRVEQLARPTELARRLPTEAAEEELVEELVEPYWEGAEAEDVGGIDQEVEERDPTVRLRRLLGMPTAPEPEQEKEEPVAEPSAERPSQLRVSEQRRREVEEERRAVEARRAEEEALAEVRRERAEREVEEQEGAVSRPSAGARPDTTAARGTAQPSVAFPGPLPPPRFVALCRDGTYLYATVRDEAICVRNGGVRQWLSSPPTLRR